MIPDIMTNKKFQATIKELFIRCKIEYISCFYLLFFLKIYNNYTNEPYSFFTIDTRLPAGNPMRFRNNFSDSLL